MALEGKSLLGELLACSCSFSVVFLPQLISSDVAGSPPLHHGHSLGSSCVDSSRYRTFPRQS